MEDSSVSSSGIEDLDTLIPGMEPPPLDDYEEEPHKPVVENLEDIPSSTTPEVIIPEAKEPIPNNAVFVASEETEAKPYTNGSAVKHEEVEQINSVAEVMEPAREALSSWPALWLLEHKIDDRVIKLIYWNEWQKTAGIFGGVLFLLLSLTCYSFLSVVTTLAMSLLAVSFLYRIGMTIVNAVQKTSAEHPLRHLLDQNIELNEDCVREWSERGRVRINRYLQCAQHLFLIKDVVDSLKFGVLLWLTSYVTAWFSLLTMIILTVIAVFTLPKTYDVYQVEIDQAFSIAAGKLAELKIIVESKIPPSVKAYTKKTQ